MEGLRLAWLLWQRPSILAYIRVSVAVHVCVVPHLALPPLSESGPLFEAGYSCYTLGVSMSGPIFVQDSEGRPLMPIAAARARMLIQQGKAALKRHHAFTLLQLAQPVTHPSLRPVVLGVVLHYRTAELFVLAEGTHTIFPLLRVIIDLQTDLPRRIRRRAMHRRRRRQRGRYRAPRRYGRPFKQQRVGRSPCRHPPGKHPGSSSSCSNRRSHISPTIHWRAQAVERVMKALNKLVPISHIVLLDTFRMLHLPFSRLTPVEQRQHLIAMYGLSSVNGCRKARCAYCGTTNGPIEVEHIVPLSRGGTDAQSNLTLACTACNRRKGDRTPDEAGMVPHFPERITQSFSQRAAPYIRLTARLLAEQLQHKQIIVVAQGYPSDALSGALFIALTTFVAAPDDAMTVIAKPISRPRKQVFTARNYPLSTPLRSGLEQVGQTIKRRNRVNLGLILQRPGQQTSIVVLKAGAAPVERSGRQIIRLGMLCRAEKSGEPVTGIVQAVHSSGKLSLITPTRAHTGGISWQRIIISPSQNLVVLSTERVIFLNIPPSSTCMRDTQEATDE